MWVIKEINRKLKDPSLFGMVNEGFVRAFVSSTNHALKLDQNMKLNCLLTDTFVYKCVFYAVNLLRSACESDFVVMIACARKGMLKLHHSDI